MSTTGGTEPVRTDRGDGEHLLIEGKAKDLGELMVRRVLPAPERRMVGPFVFFDHFGPVEFAPDEGIDVRPHPHICLATVTYLFDGEIVHRDSLGIVQAIRPGAVNLMTAGRGIVHSERSAEDRTKPRRLHGIQTWMALPGEQEECEPAFTHYAADALPRIGGEEVETTVIIGRAFGHESPVAVASETLYLAVVMQPASSFTPPEDCVEIAIYVVEGEVQVNERNVTAGSMLAFGKSRGPVRCKKACRLMVIGGEPLSHRHLWWNFVSTSKDRIEEAKRDWREGRFEHVPGDPEFIPLPDV